jgi:hypothetical protein
MKRNKSLRAAGILVAIILVTAIALSGTLARYTAVAEGGSLSARVGAFKVLLNGVDITLLQNDPDEDNYFSFASLLSAYLEDNLVTAEHLILAEELDDIAEAIEYDGALHLGWLEEDFDEFDDDSDFADYASEFGIEGAHIVSAFTDFNGDFYDPEVHDNILETLMAEWIIVPGHGRYLTFTLQNLSEVPVEVDLFAGEDAIVTAGLPLHFAMAGMPLDGEEEDEIIDEIISNMGCEDPLNEDASDFEPFTVAGLGFDSKVVLPAISDVYIFVLAWVWDFVEFDAVPDSEQSALAAAIAAATVGLDATDDAAEIVTITAAVTAEFLRALNEDNDLIDTNFGIAAANWVWDFDDTAGDGVWVVNDDHTIGELDETSILEALPTAEVASWNEFNDYLTADNDDVDETPGFFFDDIGIRVTQVDTPIEEDA